MAVTPEQKAERIARADRSVERTKEAFDKLKVRHEKAQTAYEEAVWRRACLDSLPVAGQPARALSAVPPWEEPATAATPWFDHESKHGEPTPVAEPLTVVGEAPDVESAAAHPRPCHWLDEQSQANQRDGCTHVYDDATHEWLDSPVVVNEIGDTAADVAKGEASAARAHDARVAADTKAYEASIAAAQSANARPQMTKAQKDAVAAARARRKEASTAPVVDPFGAPTV